MTVLWLLSSVSSFHILPTTREQDCLQSPAVKRRRTSARYRQSRLREFDTTQSFLCLHQVQPIPMIPHNAGIQEVPNHLTLPAIFQITSHLDRLQAVEKDLAALKTATAQKDDVSNLRGEMKKVYVSSLIVFSSILLDKSQIQAVSSERSQVLLLIGTVIHRLMIIISGRTPSRASGSKSTCRAGSSTSS